MILKIRCKRKRFDKNAIFPIIVRQTRSYFLNVLFMLKFLRESIKEFDHVVWPTRAETKKYLSIVLSIIVSLTVILFALGSVFAASLSTLRDVTAPIRPASTVTNSTTPPLDLSGVQFSTGESSTGNVVSTGSVITPTVHVASGSVSSGSVK